MKAVIPSMTTTEMSRATQSGRMHSTGNAVQRAAQTLSFFPLPQKVLLLPLGLGLLLLFSFPGFMT